MTDEQFLTQYATLFNTQEAAYTAAVADLRTALAADTGSMGKLTAAVVARAKMSGLTERKAQAEYRTGTPVSLPTAYHVDPVDVLTSAIRAVAQAAKDDQAGTL